MKRAQPPLTARTLFIAGTLVASGALALAYALAGAWDMALLCAAVGGGWLVGQRLRWRWSANLALAATVTLAVLGAWRGLGGGWLLVTVVAALAAWDLHHFDARVQAPVPGAPVPGVPKTGATETGVPQTGETNAGETPPRGTATSGATEPDTAEQVEENAARLERRHLERLGAVCGLGLLAGALPLLVRLSLRFGVVFLLGVIAILSLARLVGLLREQAE